MRTHAAGLCGCIASHMGLLVSPDMLIAAPALLHCCSLVFSSFGGQGLPDSEQWWDVQALMFVVAEEMSNAERATPNSGLLWQCCQILAAEVAIDVLKHAVLGRFNEIRPGVYREFMRVSPWQASGSCAVE